MRIILTFACGAAGLVLLCASQNAIARTKDDMQTKFKWTSELAGSDISYEVRKPAVTAEGPRAAIIDRKSVV
jgi:hypothetical protein